MEEGGKWGKRERRARGGDVGKGKEERSLGQRLILDILWHNKEVGAASIGPLCRGLLSVGYWGKA